MLAPSLWIELGFATELLLKCHLATAGLNESQVKKYGHDLKRAFDKAVQTGLVLELVEDLRDLVMLLWNSHKDCSFRYMPDGKPFQSSKEVDRVLEVIGELERTLRPKITVPEVS